MKVAVGSDHAGYTLKQRLVEKLKSSGHQVEDVGTFSEESTDYPDYAAAVGRKVAAGDADKGLLVCSSGVGMSIAANKVRGVRAALGVSADEVSYTRRHNDANVLAIGAKYTEPELAETLVDTFLATEFEGGRHTRRVEKIQKLEQEESE
jgi:ribose 5-phosphate isomerase B